MLVITETNLNNRSLWQLCKYLLPSLQHTALLARQSRSSFCGTVAISVDRLLPLVCNQSDNAVDRHSNTDLKTDYSNGRSFEEFRSVLDIRGKEQYVTEHHNNEK